MDVVESPVGTFQFNIRDPATGFYEFGGGAVVYNHTCLGLGGYEQVSPPGAVVRGFNFTGSTTFINSTVPATALSGLMYKGVLPRRVKVSFQVNITRNWAGPPATALFTFCKNGVFFGLTDAEVDLDLAYGTKAIVTKSDWQDMNTNDVFSVGVRSNVIGMTIWVEEIPYDA
jgi:hypothetical protein